MRKPSGFTLLEILVVIIILSVMASILIPTIGTNHRKAQDAAETLVLMINMAKQETIMTSRIWQLVVDTERELYHFQQLGNLEFEATTTRPLAGEHDISPAKFDELMVNGQNIKTERAQVYLFPTGEQDTLRLVLKSGEFEYSVVMGPVGPAQLVR